MAWVESHTTLIRHRKVTGMARDLGMKPVQALGHLTALWHAILEQQEDGDLSGWSDEAIADAAHFEGDPSTFAKVLRDRQWLDVRDGKRLWHDWLDYVGLYLTRRYSRRNKARLVDIWSKHGRIYGVSEDAGGDLGERRASNCRSPGEQLSLAPNLTNQPDLPDQTKPTPPPPRGGAGAAEVFEGFIPEGLRTTRFLGVWAEWCEHRREKRSRMTKTAAKRLLAKLGRWGLERAIAAIENSIANGYTGIFEEGGNGGGKPGPGVGSSRLAMPDGKLDQYHAKTRRAGPAPPAAGAVQGGGADPAA